MVFKSAQLGKYELRSEIGRGGMGIVYLGHDPALGRPVAIKVLASHLVWKKEFLERFVREAQAAARIKHPNIVTIYDVVEKSGNLFIAMEYIEGQELSNFCSKETALKPQQATTIIAHICNGQKELEHFRRQSII